jgi:hypothetical protein
MSSRLRLVRLVDLGESGDLVDRVDLGKRVILAGFSET